MNYHSVVGYILIGAGVLLIVVPLWQAFGIFTGQALPPQIFMRPIQDSNVSGGTDMESQIQRAVMDVIPVDALYHTLNLGNWVILMGILMYGGGKLADIGIKLSKA